MTIDAPPAARARVEWALERFFTARRQRAAAYGPEFSRLWDLAAEHSRGGKLLRPRLFVDALDAFECAAGAPGTIQAIDGDTVDRLAAVLEVLHYAFLLHDDVIDGDLIRRHRPNLVGAVRDLHPAAPAGDSLHWGTSAAILMGDLLLSSVVLECARLELPVAAHTRVLDLIDEAITETVAGEHLDVGLGDGAITPDLHTVMTMTTLKTATYSFALPLRLAAALIGAPSRVDEDLKEVGRRLGIAFQVQDDLLTMFGRHASHGKDALSDVREGKETVLVSYARTTERWNAISDLFGDPLIGEADAERVRSVVAESGARAFAEELIASELDAAARIVAESEIPAPVRLVVADCVERIKGRTS